MSGELVLHVAKASGVSGSENHLLSLLPGLRAAGWDARFVLLHEGEPGAQELRERLTEAGVPVEAIELPHVADPRPFRRLVATMRGAAPAIAHTHLVHADFLGQAAARLARVPVRASTKHGFNEFRSRRGFGLADRAATSGIALHVAISRGLARYLAEEEGFDEHRFEVVHYGIAAGPPPPPPAAPTSLAVVGRLIPIKGHATLLAALDGVPDAVVEIAGDGPLGEQLRAAAARFGERVRFAGRVAPATPVLERAGVVVVPSLGEGFGMVALEAMERGRAVIASAVGGLPEIVEDGVTGLLVPPSDPRSLRDAILALAGDPSRAAAMGEAGRRRALDAFSQERNVTRTIELYERALSGSTGAAGRRARTSDQARSSANAASSASRKSHGAR